MNLAHGAVWAICALAIAGVLVRPWGLPEAVWAGLGAFALLASSLLGFGDALSAILAGTDVYLFLFGMMLLAELARETGLFDWVAALAVRAAKGSANRLFALVYCVGALVTVLLSNDATAVVLTPAVAAAARSSRAEDPLPYLLVCAFVANAASFVLPISNPANLVIFGAHLPSLGRWLPTFAWPSVLSVTATFGVLWLTQRRALRNPIAARPLAPPLSAAARVAAVGILGTAVALTTASALGRDLGPPACVAGLSTAAAVAIASRKGRFLAGVARNLSWSVLPLVGALFILVRGLERTGIVQHLAQALHALAAGSSVGATWGVGVGLALLTNLMNNLPAGLLAGSAVQAAHVPDQVMAAALIGVDLGPNLSVTGSLATILWLTALRREGLHLSAWAFLRVGALVMVPALVLSLLALSLWG